MSTGSWYCWQSGRVGLPLLHTVVSHLSRVSKNFFIEIIILCENKIYQIIRENIIFSLLINLIECIMN